jgi:hypothetical protein
VFSGPSARLHNRTAIFRNLWTPLLLAAASAAFALQAVGFRYLSDDAFITFRYAQNWADGYGPIYNVGETAEGYTNFLWMAILAGLDRAGADIVLAAQVLGVVLGVATILLTFRFSLRWHSARSLWAALAAVLLALNVAFAAWATGGLETHLFTFLVLLSAFLHLQEMDDPHRAPWSGVAMALLVMARPDGLVFVGLSVLHRLWVHRGRLARQDLLWGSAFALLYGPYYAWRFAYYGYPFPNTFYAKVGGGPERFLRGWEHVAGFVLEYGGGPLAILAGLLVILRQLNRDCAFLTLQVAGFMGYVIWIGGDSLIEYRFLLAITPLLYLLIQESVWKVTDLARGWQRKRAFRAGLFPPALLGTILCGLAYLLVAQPSVQGSRQRVVRTRVQYEDFATMGKWLRDQVPREASLAVHHAGAMPFYSRLTTLDLYGLNDVHIAHRVMPDLGKGYAGHEKYDVDYMLSRRPTYIAPLPLRNRPFDLEDWHHFDEDPWFPDNEEMLDSPLFQSLYSLRSVDLSASVSSDYGTIFNFFQLRDISLTQDRQVVWDFGGDRSTAGWSSWTGMEAKAVEGSAVLLNAIQPDSSIEISDLQLWATPCDRLTIQMRVTAGTEARVSWLNGPPPRKSEFQSLSFQVEPDGQYHTYELEIGDRPFWAGTIASLRLQPTNQPAEIEIDAITFERACGAS